MATMAKEVAMMIIELANCTNTLLAEIGDKQCKQKDIAKTYALAINSSESTDWKAVNLAIIDRWSRSGLERIKSMAWSGKCWQ